MNKLKKGEFLTLRFTPNGKHDCIIEWDKKGESGIINLLKTDGHETDVLTVTIESDEFEKVCLIANFRYKGLTTLL